MCKTLLRLKKSLVLAFALVASLGASAQTQITDEEGLRAMSSGLSGNYVLAADITLTSEWVPVGTTTAPFTGTFNGNGHAIKGLTITTGTDVNGLFGVASGATIQNVRIEGALVQGQNHVGILAARAIEGTVVDRVFTSGYVTGNDHVGGIVGHTGETNSSATIKNCMSTAYIYDRGYQGGGISGWSKGTTLFENNLFLGRVYVGSWGGCGGIVAFYEDGTATLTGNVCAASSLTGNTGDAPVSNGARYTFGIAGGPLNANSILVANNNLVSESTIIYDREGKVVDVSSFDEGHTGTPTSEASLKTPATYTGIGFNASAWSLASGRYPVLAGMTVPIAGDYIYTEKFPDFFVETRFDTKAFSTLGRDVTITSSNPSVVKVDGTLLEGLAAGTATVTISTQGDAYIAGYTITKQIKVSNMDTNINSVADLDKLVQNPTGEFNLMVDLDLAGVSFAPLPEFSGVLHGNGHVIRNMIFQNQNQDNVGLFVSTRSALIEDLGFEDINLLGNANVGAVAGHVYGGSIERVYVSNSDLRGRDHVGSIAGDISNDNGEPSFISDCISDSRISTWQYQTGGIAGVANGALLQNCLFSGTLDNEGQTCNSGLVSLLDSDGVGTTIQNCLSAAAHINGGTNPRLIQLAGRKMSLLNNYVIASTLYSGATKSDTGNADSADGLLIVDSEAKTKDFYVKTLGWDFENTWKFFEGAEGKMYPVLKWMKAPLKVRYFDFPTEPLVYTDGIADYKDLSTIHGSWGQDFTATITGGSQYVDYIDTDKQAWCSDLNGNYLGSGTVEVTIGIAPELASYFTIIGDNKFTFITTMKDEVIEIRTPQDFMNIANNPVGNYILLNDIDMKGVTFKGLFNENGSFRGVLNGQGHRVKNATVEIASGNDKGIFGKTSNAAFKNIAFENFQVLSTINGANHVGFVGFANSTTFEKVALTGKVVGRDHVALLAGDGAGVSVKDCYVWGDVQAYSQVGGFFGCTLEGTCKVENSYFNGDLSAQYRGWVGGFVGLIDKAESTVTIQSCVSIGNCSSTGEGSPHVAAPFIAGNGADTSENGKPNAKVFFNDNISNIDAVMVGDLQWPDVHTTADGGDVAYDEQLSVDDLKEESPYTGIGWDFAGTWSWDKSKYDFPVLKQLGFVPFEIKTGIENVNVNDNANDNVNTKGVFDLSGRRVNSNGKLPKGIYVIDGHKIVVK